MMHYSIHLHTDGRWHVVHAVPGMSGQWASIGSAPNESGAQKLADLVNAGQVRTAAPRQFANVRVVGRNFRALRAAEIVNFETAA